jgi:hypothetical protein
MKKLLTVVLMIVFPGCQAPGPGSAGTRPGPITSSPQSPDSISGTSTIVVTRSIGQRAVHTQDRSTTGNAGRVPPEIVDAPNEEVFTGKWRCLEIPGFLIMSRGDPWVLQERGDEIRRAVVQLAPLLPPSGWGRENAGIVPVVLFSSPPGEYDEMKGRNRSYVGSFVAEKNIVAINTWQPDSVGGVDDSGIDASRVRFRFQYWRRSTPAILAYYRKRMEGADFSQPAWLSFGFHGLVFRVVPSSDGGVFFPETRSLTAVGRQDEDSLNLPGVPMREVFADFGQRARHPVNSVPASGQAPRQALAVNERLQQFINKSVLFAYWGLLDGDENRRMAWWEFAGEAIEESPSDETCLKHFALSMDELDLALDEILIDGDGALPAAKVPAGRPVHELSVVRVRDATDEEIAMLRAALKEAEQRMETAAPIHVPRRLLSDILETLEET